MYSVIEKILTSENIEKSIAERLKYLNSEEYQKTRRKKAEYYSGFCKKNEKVDVTTGCGYCFDDDSIYYTLIKKIQDKMKKYPEKDYKKFILMAVFETVNEYFQCDKTDGERYMTKLCGMFPNNPRWKSHVEYIKYINKDKSEEELLNIIELQARECFPYLIELEGGNGSIETIKHLGIAKCVEYAAMTNQLFSFLGIECYYVKNKLMEKGENNAEGHAYNVIKTQRGYHVVDVINNIVFILKDEEEAQNLMEGNARVSPPDSDLSYGQNAIY